MNPKEFKKALDFICKEKGIDEDVVVEAMQAALATAYRKNEGKKEDNVRVDVDTKTGNIRVFALYNVVEDDDAIENFETEITLEESVKYGAHIV